MKVSLNWLRELVSYRGDSSELRDVLTMAGVEVENVEQRGVAGDGVVVAQVIASERHPNADRLSVCRVDDGSGQERQIVCGATNYQVGDKVPLALPGAVLADDLKIKAGKIRGVESHGMLCSAKELRLAEDAEGLLILTTDAEIGAPISALFPPDEIFDLEITPNRADLLSHLGIAREIAGLTGSKLLWSQPEPAPTSESDLLRINALENCPFYTARRIQNVRVGPSPQWVREKLASAGVRAINNIVDITNFVMLELGQPLHAFDADELSAGIVVRMARADEKLLAFDGQTYRLGEENLVIADEQKAIAIAGVMGGEETGVVESTRNIVLESAYFRAANIRRTARNLGLITDSSYRFERGVDSEMVLIASQRATQLICELAGGDAADATEISGAAPDLERVVEVRPARCNSILGCELADSEIDDILSRLGFQKLNGSWRVPSHRQDVTREIDLIEEIARIVGIERVPARRRSWFAPSTDADRSHDSRMRVRRMLAGCGFFEARTLSLISEESARAGYPEGELRRVRNPLNEEQEILRPSLIPGLVDALEINFRAVSNVIRVFEIGRVFRGDVEETFLGLAMSGPVEAVSWRQKNSRNADLFDLKGIISALPIQDLRFRVSTEAVLAPSLEIFSGEQKIGLLGQLPPRLSRERDLRAPAIIAELDLFFVESPDLQRRSFIELEKHPAIVRDMALIAPKNVTHEQIESFLRAQKEPLLESVELFDLFTDPTGEKVPADSRSLAYSLTFRSKERTLTIDEVNVIHARLKARLKDELAVQIRE